VAGFCEKGGETLVTKSAAALSTILEILDA